MSINKISSPLSGESSVRQPVAAQRGFVDILKNALKKADGCTLDLTGISGSGLEISSAVETRSVQYLPDLGADFTHRLLN